MSITNTTAPTEDQRMEQFKPLLVPFPMRANIPNAETIEAIREVEQMKQNPEQYAGYGCFDALLQDVVQGV